MKKIGEYTCRGQMNAENVWNRITLFDGRFDTAYRLIFFEVCPYNVKTAANDVTAKVATDDSAFPDGALWSWEDNREIAWASAELRVSFGPSFSPSVVDEDNLIVEDCYVCYGHVGTDDPVNYLMKFEKYEISEWRGALAMVRSKSQDV
jgi:hypothetical protein